MVKVTSFSSNQYHKRHFEGWHLMIFTRWWIIIIIIIEISTVVVVVVVVAAQQQYNNNGVFAVYTKRPEGCYLEGVFRFKVRGAIQRWAEGKDHSMWTWLRREREYESSDADVTFVAVTRLCCSCLHTHMYWVRESLRENERERDRERERERLVLPDWISLHKTRANACGFNQHKRRRRRRREEEKRGGGGEGQFFTLSCCLEVSDLTYEVPMCGNGDK